MFKKKSTMEIVRSGREDRRDEDPEQEIPPENEPDGREIKNPKKEKPKRDKKPKSPPVGRANFFRTRYFVGICCIVLAFVLYFWLVPEFLERERDVVTVLAFTSNAAGNTQISEEMLERVEMTDHNLPFGVQTDPSEVVGMFLTADVIAGDLVTSGRLSSAYPGDNLELASLPEGKVAVSVTLANMSQSLSSKLRAGDVIQLFAVTASVVGESGGIASPPELQYVEVLSVSDGSGSEVSTAAANTVNTVTLILTERQALSVISLEYTATLHAALVVRGNETAKAAALEAQEAYLAQLALEEAEEEPEDVEDRDSGSDRAVLNENESETDEEGEG